MQWVSLSMRLHTSTGLPQAGMVTARVVQPALVVALISCGEQAAMLSLKIVPGAQPG